MVTLENNGEKPAESMCGEVTVCSLVLVGLCQRHRFGSQVGVCRAITSVLDGTRQTLLTRLVAPHHLIIPARPAAPRPENAALITP